MVKGFKGARAKCVTVEFNGEEYKASPLTFDDFSQIWDILQSRKLRIINRGIDDKELKRELIREALNCPMSSEFLQQLGTFDGIKLLVYTSISKEHPDVSEEDIGNLPIDKIEELSDIITAISGLEGEEGEKKGLDEEEKQV